MALLLTGAAFDSVFFVVTGFFGDAETGSARLFVVVLFAGAVTAFSAVLLARAGAVVFVGLAALVETTSIDFAVAFPVPALARPEAVAFTFDVALAGAASARCPADAPLVVLVAVVGDFAVFFIALAIEIKPNETNPYKTERTGSSRCVKKS